MSDSFESAPKRHRFLSSSEHSAAEVLRRELFEQLSPVLLLSNEIENTDTRLMIQALCLDMVSALEGIIERYRLDHFQARAVN